MLYYSQTVPPYKFLRDKGVDIRRHKDHNYYVVTMNDTIIYYYCGAMKYRFQNTNKYIEIDSVEQFYDDVIVPLLIEMID